MELELKPEGRGRQGLGVGRYWDLIRGMFLNVDETVNLIGQ